MNPEKLQAKASKLETISQAQILRWREKRGDGWSDTIYSGLFLEINGKPMLISKLSHGLRVLPRKGDSYYSFEGGPINVEISESFIDAAKVAFEANVEFQKRLDEYEQAISGK